MKELTDRHPRERGCRDSQSQDLHLAVTARRRIGIIQRTEHAYVRNATGEIPVNPFINTKKENHEIGMITCTRYARRARARPFLQAQVNR